MPYKRSSTRVDSLTPPRETLHSAAVDRGGHLDPEIRRCTVQIPKDQILQLLRSRGEDGKADEAQAQLPDQVDPEQHADLLQRLGIDPKELLSSLGGVGGIAGKLGL
jgi:hypothetical protein